MIAGVVAAGVTFGLFLFMFKLVSMGSDQRTELEAISGIHFGPVEIPVGSKISESGFPSCKGFVWYPRGVVFRPDFPGYKAGWES